MKLPVFQKILTQDYAVNQLQNNIAQFVNTLAVQPLSSGNLLKSIILVTGSNTIYHTLNAPLQGYIITNADAAITTFNAGSTNPTSFFILNSSAPANVDIFVF